MTKAKRQMQEDIKLIDLIIELVDSRVPLASRNPDIDELGKMESLFSGERVLCGKSRFPQRLWYESDSGGYSGSLQGED